jgi:putative oxidoreductase
MLGRFHRGRQAVNNDKTGKFVLRVALGVIVLLHGIAKLRNGVGFIEGMVTSHGLPAWFAYGAYAGEVVGPLMLIAGFYARLGAALVAINMLVAIWLVHLGDLFALNPQSGGWALELQGLMLFAAIAVMLIGPGKPGINEK